MLRRIVLAVAGLVMSQAASAAELPIAELAFAPFVSGAPSVMVLVPTARETPAARLVWLDPTGVALGTEAVVRPEVLRLLRQMGVEATWRRGEPQELARTGELRVIFLNRATQRRDAAQVLGATPPSFQGERFVWVHVPSVRVAAGVSTQRTGPSLDIHSVRRLGIALARVIAHEAVHSLAPALPHGPGLMSSRLDRSMLTGARIAIDPLVGLSVRTALAGARLASQPPGAILAVESSYKEPYR